jgi:hypothetical protein
MLLFLWSSDKQLDEVCTTILKYSITLKYTEEKEELYYILRYILGSIAVLFSLPFVYSLSRLLCIAKEDIDQTLADLYSILDVSKNWNRSCALIN